jgi:YHS domain-containing protein
MSWVIKIVLGLFKKKDPVCGMTEEKGKGIKSESNWFCSEKCKIDYEKKVKSMKEVPSCCQH